MTAPRRPLADARVLAVHVGAVDDLPYRDRTIRSAFRKREVAGPVEATADGLVGDEQGDRVKHGGPDKAICVFPAEHYADYEAHLGRPLERPAFGENLTVAGLREEDVCLGDRLLVGTVACEVSLPRNPCYRLGARHATTEIVLAMERSGRTGFYLRVLEAGRVVAGAEIRLLDRPHPRATVAEANRVMHRDKRDGPALDALLAVPQLGASWRRTFERRRTAGTIEDPDRRRYGPLGAPPPDGPARG